MQGLVCLGSGAVGIGSALERLMLWELGLAPGCRGIIPRCVSMSHLCGRIDPKVFGHMSHVCERTHSEVCLYHRKQECALWGQCSLQFGMDHTPV